MMSEVLIVRVLADVEKIFMGVAVVSRCSVCCIFCVDFQKTIFETSY